MFKINKDKSIHVTRGDSASIELKMKEGDGYHQFKKDDKVTFSVKKDFAKAEAVLRKEITVEQDTDTVYISLTPKDTRIGGLISKSVKYQYDIEFNDNQTIIGFDDKGKKEFILYPEGSKDE